MKPQTKQSTKCIGPCLWAIRNSSRGGESENGTQQAGSLQDPLPTAATPSSVCAHTQCSKTVKKVQGATTAMAELMCLGAAVIICAQIILHN